MSKYVNLCSSNSLHSHYFFQSAKFGNYILKYPRLAVEILIISLNKALLVVLKCEYILIKIGSDEILRKNVDGAHLCFRKICPVEKIVRPDRFFEILYSFVKTVRIRKTVLPNNKTYEAIILVFKSSHCFRFLIKGDNYKIIMFLI